LEAARSVAVLTGAGVSAVEVNLEPTPLTPIAHEAHHGKAGEILPRLLGNTPTLES
jgi:NAD-dependent SIR2 family protein deacetylase